MEYIREFGYQIFWNILPKIQNHLKFYNSIERTRKDAKDNQIYCFN